MDIEVLLESININIYPQNPEGQVFLNSNTISVSQFKPSFPKNVNIPRGIFRENSYIDLIIESVSEIARG